jgi:hypothetical protein
VPCRTATENQSVLRYRFSIHSTHPRRPRPRTACLFRGSRSGSPERRPARFRVGGRPGVRRRAIDCQLAPASVESSSRAAATAFHARGAVRARVLLCARGATAVSVVGSALLSSQLSGAHGRGRSTAAAFSLIVRGSSSTSSRVASPRCRSGLRWAHFSFGARVGAECVWELPRRLNSMQGRQAARKQRELAEAGSGRRGAAGLKGCWRERTCQAAIRILRATAALAGFLPARSARSV